MLRNGDRYDLLFKVEDDFSGMDLDVSVGGRRCGLVEQSVASSLPKKKTKKKGKNDDDDELLDMAMNAAHRGEGALAVCR